MTDFNRILKISAGYVWILVIYQWTVVRVINLKNRQKKAMFRSNPTAGYQGYRPDINALCTPDIMSCHFLIQKVLILLAIHVKTIKIPS